MRYTLHYWICWAHHENPPEARECFQCGARRFERNAQVHSSEKAVVYLNPSTGERRVPARADQPIPEVYARQGFERVEINSMIEYEKRTGTVHEASNYRSGNEPVEPELNAPRLDPSARTDLVNEMRSMLASGPVTMRSDDSPGPDLP